MPNFFDGILKTLDKGAKVVTTRSTSFIEINKLKNELNGLKKSKNESLIEIGKKVVDLKDAFALEKVTDQLKAIENFDMAIQVKESEIQGIKEETDEKINDIDSGVSKVNEEEVANATEVDIEVEQVDDDFNSDFQVNEDSGKEAEKEVKHNSEEL